MLFTDRGDSATHPSSAESEQGLQGSVPEGALAHPSLRKAPPQAAFPPERLGLGVGQGGASGPLITQNSSAASRGRPGR